MMLNLSFDKTRKDDRAIVPRAIDFLANYAPPSDPTVFTDPLFLQAMLEYAFEDVMQDSAMVTGEMVRRAREVMTGPSLHKLPELSSDSRFIGHLLFFALTGRPFGSGAGRKGLSVAT